MGTFHVDIELFRPGRQTKGMPVKRLIVDTGSKATWIPEEILKQAGIGVQKKDQRFIMANGETITRDIGYAVLRSGEFETIDEVVFAKAGDLSLLGSRTLEGFNARVDAPRKAARRCRPYPCGFESPAHKFAISNGLSDSAFRLLFLK
jgi:predicted aspartyl protease